MANFIQEYWTKLYAIYFLRWQLSTLVMMPFMFLINTYFPEFPQWVVLIIIQAIGSVVMFKVDKWIFTNKKER